MRSTFMHLFFKSPFENLKLHADKVAECGKLFQRAVECHLASECEEFNSLTDKVAKMESEADEIKRNIRGHLPRGILMPVDNFQFFLYLREQDKVLDSVEESLFWLSFRPQAVDEQVGEDIHYLVKTVVPIIEKLAPMVEEAHSYFRSRSEERRVKIKSMIRDIRQIEKESDHLEKELKMKVFGLVKDTLQVYHLVRLVETIGEIADHAQNATDMMRAMIAT